MIREGHSERLRPEDRVRRKADFDEAYAHGVRVPSRSFTLIIRDAGRGRVRLGVTVSKSVGNAVVRNAVRRRVREVFRRSREVVLQPVDIIFHLRPQAAAARYDVLREEFREAMVRYWERQERRR